MSLPEKHIREGHPSVEKLIAEQGISFPRDPQDLLGDFWPEEETADEFLAALREWRGHTKTDPAACSRLSSIRTWFRSYSRTTAERKRIFGTSAIRNG
jgi:hypothetical protein